MGDLSSQDLLCISHFSACQNASETVTGLKSAILIQHGVALNRDARDAWSMGKLRVICMASGGAPELWPSKCSRWGLRFALEGAEPTMTDWGKAWLKDPGMEGHIQSTESHRYG